MIVILCKYNSVLILRAGQLGVLGKYTSRLEGKNIIQIVFSVICLLKELELLLELIELS